MPGSDPIKIGDVFQEYTKYKYFTVPSDMVLGRPAPPVEKAFPPDAQPIDLPRENAGDEQAAWLWRLIESRRSRRSFSRVDLSLEELATLLWVTQGVVQAAGDHTLRTVPSAGARHPLETYLIVNNVASLDRGLYRYLPVEHQLVQLRQESVIGEQASDACLEQRTVASCAVTFAWTAVIDRARWKYQQRAYRYIYLDAGHVCQNLYLACEAMGLSCCAIAAFDDELVCRLLDVDGREEFAVYLAAVGKRVRSE